MNLTYVQVQVVASTFLVLIAVAMGQGCPPLVSYSSCMRFVHKDNQLPDFNGPCCAMIRTTSESCLCNTARNNRNMGIDLEKALSLPKTCGRKVPANTYCGNVKVPN